MYSLQPSPKGIIFLIVNHIIFSQGDYFYITLFDRTKLQIIHSLFLQHSVSFVKIYLQNYTWPYAINSICPLLVKVLCWIDSKQSLFCLRTRGKRQKTRDCVGVTHKLQALLAVCSFAYHASPRLLSWLVLSCTDFWAKERLLTVYVVTKSFFFLVSN